MKSMLRKAPRKGLWKPFYIEHLKKHWLFYSFGVASVALTNITEVMIPKFSQWVVDYVSKGKDSLPSFFGDSSDPLFILGLALVFNIFLGLVSRMGWRQFLGKQTHIAARDIRNVLWKNLSSQNLNVFNKFPTGDLINRSISDINPARFIFGFTLVFSADILFLSLIGMGVMLSIDMYVAFSVIGIFCLLPLIVSLIMKKEYELHDQAQSKLSLLSDTISEMLSSVRLTKVAGMHGVWLSKLDKETDDYASKQFELEKLNGYLWPISNTAIILAYAAVMGVGLYRFSGGFLTAGEFVGLMSLVLIVRGPLVDLSINILEWQKGISSLDRICELIALEGELMTTGKEKPYSNSQQRINISNLNFTYPALSKPLFENLDLTVSEGESVGIVGKIGAGKTTLVNILSGIVKTTDGRVELCGKEISSMSRKEVTSLVSVVGQVPFLFAGSVRENLNLDVKFSDEELWQVLSDVRLDTYFKSFDSGLDTEIGEWGVSLSGGQKQRLALARNLLRPRPVMIFDDCLSAVDVKTEAHVQRAISERAGESAAVWVAHRKSTLSRCDRIYTLRDGRFSHE